MGFRATTPILFPGGLLFPFVMVSPTAAAVSICFADAPFAIAVIFLVSPTWPQSLIWDAVLWVLPDLVIALTLTKSFQVFTRHAWHSPPSRRPGWGASPLNTALKLGGGGSPSLMRLKDPPLRKEVGLTSPSHDPAGERTWPGGRSQGALSVDVHQERTPGLGSVPTCGLIVVRLACFGLCI